MAQTKRRAVFTAEPEQLQRIEALVARGRFASASEFLRAAIDDKLRALADAELDLQVEQSCRRRPGPDDDALMGAQAWDD
jgi:Arc/MetJ-type ribon-helix-helix transcriptional regulator